MLHPNHNDYTWNEETLLDLTMVPPYIITFPLSLGQLTGKLVFYMSVRPQATLYSVSIYLFQSKAPNSYLLTHLKHRLKLSAYCLKCKYTVGRKTVQ